MPSQGKSIQLSKIWYNGVGKIADAARIGSPDIRIPTIADYQRNPPLNLNLEFIRIFVDNRLVRRVIQKWVTRIAVQFYFPGYNTEISFFKLFLETLAANIEG